MFFSIKSSTGLNGPQRDPTTWISFTTTSFSELSSLNVAGISGIMRLLVVDFKTTVPIGLANLHAVANPVSEPEHSITTSKLLSRFVMVEYVFTASGT